MSFLRQRWKQKIKQYGPVSRVQSSLFHNLESIGVDPQTCALALPCWGPGDQRDYSKYAVESANSNTLYQSNKLVFNGSSSTIRTSNKPILPYLTVIARVTPASLDDYNFIATRDDFGTASADWWFSALSGTLMFAREEGDFIGSQTGVVLSVGVTKTVCFSFNGTTVKMYVDGFFVSCTNSTVSNRDMYSTQEIDIGCRKFGETANLWNGSIDHVNIFDYALSPSQIAQISDNPNALWQRVAPISYFFPVGGSGGETIKRIFDNGYGSDLIFGISNACRVSDVGSGADDFGGMSAALSVQDTGTGVDSIPMASVSLSVSDVGSAVDTVSQILSSLLVQDSGFAIDLISQILAAATVSDSAHGDDSVSILSDLLKTIKVLDTGSGVDSVLSPTVSLSVYDSGTAIDLTSILASLSVTDTATADELIKMIKTYLVTVQDSGTGTDSVSVSVSLTVSDTGTAIDAVGQVLAALKVADAGAGTDRVIKTDFNLLASGKVTVTFSMSIPGVTFDLKTPGIDFDME